MKYQSLEQIVLEADVHPGVNMSRRERLERWVELLERQPHRRLATIEGTEFGSRREREAKRADHSPVTVAFDDPVLRAAGLRGVALVTRSRSSTSRTASCIAWSATFITDARSRPVPLQRAWRMIAQQDGPASLSSRGDGHRRPVGRGCARAHVVGALSQLADLVLPAGAVACSR
jgi:hypothetical protein